MQPSAARVVTPEAVVLDLPTASAGSRVLARALDLCVAAAALLAVAAASGVGVNLGGGVAVIIVQLLFDFALLLAYPALMEAFWGGRTLGKAAFGLRVVKVDGSPISLRHAAIRAGLGLLEVWATAGSLGLIVMLASKRDQRLGDMAAGTLVLRERRGGSLRPVQLLVPPGCEQIVAALDVGAMTPGDYEMVRLFLVRWHEFRADERSAVAAKLAGPLWQRFRHPVPAWLGPDSYLACLGAAYQYRHPVASTATSTPPAASARQAEFASPAAPGSAASWRAPTGETPAPPPEERGGWVAPS